MHQGLEDLVGFALVLDERVALALGAQAHAFAQGVHVHEVLLPQAVDGLQHDAALHGVDAVGALALHFLGVELADFGDDGVLHHVGRHVVEVDVFLAEAQGEGGVEPLQEIRVADDARAVFVEVDLALEAHAFAQGVVEHFARLLAEEGAVAQAVDDGALLVHDVVVVEHVLAPHVVALFDALLRPLDDLVHEAVLDGFAFFHAEAVHHLGHALAAAEVAHEVVFEGEEELGRARVALAGAAAAQLAVDAARFVALGAEHEEAAELGHAFAQLDVRAASRHVGGDGDGAALAGEGDDLGFPLVVLGVEHLMGDAGVLEHAGEGLRGFDARRADEDGLAMGVQFADLGDDGVVLLAAALVDEVVEVFADAGLVRGDGQDVQLVDVVEFGRFGFGGAGHAREAGVEAEVVLDGDGGVGHVLRLDLHAFLGFDGLVQAFAPAAARHFAAGVLVDDDDLAFLDDVLDVLFVDGVGLEQLARGVQAAAGLVHALHEGGLARLLFALGERFVFVDVDEFGAEVRQHEVFGVAGADEFAALVHEVGVVRFLVDGEVEFLLELVEFELARVLVEEEFVFLHHAAEVRILLGAHVGAVARLAELDFVEAAAGGLRVALLGVLHGLIHEFVAEVDLRFDDFLDARLEGVVLLLALDDGGAGDDERGARFVDEDGVDLVDDGEVVAALHLGVLGGGHAVVAQVVEAEFGVGAVGDVAGVLAAAHVAGHHALDAADRQAEELEERAHPHRVASGEVVVDGDDVDAEAGQGVQVDGERGDEGLAFARGHFRDEAAMEGDAAEQLDVEVDHVPGDLGAADVDLAAAHAAGGGLDDGEGFRQDLLEVLGAEAVELGFDFGEGFLAFLDGGGGGFYFGQLGEDVLQGGEAFVERGGEGLQFFLPCRLDDAFGREVERREAMQVLLPSAGFLHEEVLIFLSPALLDVENFLDDGAQLAHLALVLGTHDLIENPLDHIGISGVYGTNPRASRGSAF